jgi:glycosyltransferase involved in cell wall biosynthesis
VNKKKILVLTSTFPRWKGDFTPPFVYELEKRLTKDFEIHILAPHYQGAKKEEMMEGLHVHRFQYFWPTQWQKLCDASGILPNLKKNKLLYTQAATLIVFELITAIKFCKKDKFDLIHAHWIIPQGLIALIINKLFGLPYIVTSHGGDIFGLQGKMMSIIERWTINNSSELIVVSKAIKKKVLTIGVRNDLGIKVISMGVDKEKFNPQRYNEKLKKQYGIKGPFLLFVGRLAEKKGVKYLILAMKDVVREIPKAKLLIIGTGTLEKELKILTKNLHLENNILFLGGIPNHQLPKYYVTADILVVPSIQTEFGDVEGVPVVLIEGLASGKVIIASSVGGIPEVITHNINGLLVPEKESQSLAQSIIDVLINDELKSKLEKEARKSSRKYDLKIIAEKFKKIYSKL